MIRTVPVHCVLKSYKQTSIRHYRRMLQTVEKPLEVSEGRSPLIANPKPATCIAAQTQPSVGFGPSGGFGTLA